MSMNVQASSGASSLALSSSAGTNTADAADFQTALADARRIHAANAAASGTQDGSSSAAAKSAAYAEQLQELNDYLKKSPVEHMRDAILKELNLTEADLAALPPQERAVIEATISEMIKEKLLRNSGIPAHDASAQSLLQQLGLAATQSAS